MLKIDLVEDSYKYALKEEDKLKRKNLVVYERKEKQDHLTKDKMIAKDEPKPIEKNRRISRGKFEGKCCKCGGEGHKSSECREKDCVRNVSMVNEVETLVVKPEQGENLMARQVLFGERTLEPCQRSSLFRTHCNSSSKVSNVIVNSGSTYNLVAEEMV